MQDFGRMELERNQNCTLYSNFKKAQNRTLSTDLQTNDLTYCLPLAL